MVDYANTLSLLLKGHEFLGAKEGLFFFKANNGLISLNTNNVSETSKMLFDRVLEGKESVADPEILKSNLETLMGYQEEYSNLVGGVFENFGISNASEEIAVATIE